MGSRCTTGFHWKYRNPYLWGAFAGSSLREVCVFVCAAQFVHILNGCLGADHPYSGHTQFNCFCFCEKMKVCISQTFTHIKKKKQLVDDRNAWWRLRPSEWKYPVTSRGLLQSSSCFDVTKMFAVEKNKTNHNHYELSHNTRLSDLWCKAKTVLLHVAQCFHLVDKIWTNTLRSVGDDRSHSGV